jgi:hypothetical protein
MPHTQADLHKAHHEVRKVLGEIARFRRRRKDISRRKRQGGSVTIEVLRHVLKEAVEHRRTIRAQLARFHAAFNAESASDIEREAFISEPMDGFAAGADAELMEDLAATANANQVSNDHSTRPVGLLLERRRESGPGGQ